MWVSAFSASAPLTLFTANQPIPATRALIPAGSMLPQYPKPRRLSTICGTPYCGPLVDRMPWVTEPSRVPSTTARKVCQKLRPKNTTPMKPTKTVANSMFGEVQVQKSCKGRPCRSLSGMNSAPPGSTAMTFSPYVPSLTSTSSLVAVMRSPWGQAWPA